MSGVVPAHGTGSARRVNVALDGVGVAYASRTVLAGISLTLEPGERVALVGRNGAGKSSLLRVLAGVQAPSAGRVRIGPHEVGALPRREAAALVSLMGQESDGGLAFLARERAGFGRFAHRRPWALPGRSEERAIDDALEAMGVGALASTPLTQLSGGERQRVRFAAAMLQAAPVALFDEPTSAQDAAGVRRMASYWAQHAAGGGVVVAAVHDLSTAARAFDRVVALHDGAVLADGPPSEVFVSRAFQAAWGDALEVLVDDAGQVWIAPRTA